MVRVNAERKLKSIGWILTQANLEVLGYEINENVYYELWISFHIRHVYFDIFYKR